MIDEYNIGGGKQRKKWTGKGQPSIPAYDKKYRKFFDVPKIAMETFDHRLKAGKHKGK